MKASHIISAVTLFIYSTACANKNNGGNGKGDNDIDSSLIVKSSVTDTFPPGKVIANVVCHADGSQAYAAYIPAGMGMDSLPVVYFFDPHGDGALPVQKYRALADSFGFIFIGSNNSKNGNDQATTENIWATLFNDTQNRFRINLHRVYLCGFSGGAKVATDIALHHPGIKGVIANGAGLPDITSAGNFSFSFTAVAGEGDMNRSDLIAINSALDKTITRHRIIFFDGIHEWAPQPVMHIAFAGLQFDGMYDKSLPGDRNFISAYVMQSKKRVAAFTRSGILLRAMDECKLSTSLLNGLTGEVSWFKEEEGLLQNNEAYTKQLQAEQSLEEAEESRKNVFMQQFQQGDMNYWVNAIHEVQSKAKAANAEGAMYQRLQAYLSLAFYSISNQLINGHQDAGARHFVYLYKMVDPTNSEAWYFSAILDARDKNGKAAREDLVKAIANGFRDRSRMMQQPEFLQIENQINLPDLEGKMQ